MSANAIEKIIERAMYASRWLLAPVYLGMSLALFALCVKFYQELYHFIPHILDTRESELILKLLTLIDLSLVGSLIVIVMFSGYENFVSKLDIDDHKDRPAWMGKVGFSGLKIKLISAIVAISAVELLKVFISSETLTNTELAWKVGIHLTFVISGVLFSITDYINTKTHNH